MKKLLLALALLFVPSLAQAQCNGIFPSNTVCGTVAGGIPKAVSPGGFSAGLTIGATTVTGGTNTRVLYDNAAIVGEYTNVQLTALIQAATASLSGALPAWPNNTTTFFRGDGTYTGITCASLPPLTGDITSSACATTFTTSVIANGVKCDGVTDDTTALQAIGTALNAAGGGTIVQFPIGATCLIYNSGQAVTNNALFNLNTGSIKSVKFNFNGSTLKVGHTFLTTETLAIFNLIQATNVTIDGANVIQTTPIVLGPTPYGTILLTGGNGTACPCNQNITLTNSSITGGFAPFEMSSTTTATLINNSSVNSFYGVVGLDNLSVLTVRGFNTSGVDRDVFLKGVSDFDISIDSINPVANSVLFSTDINNAILENGRVNYKVAKRTAGTNPASYITFANQGAFTGSIFRNIKVNVDIDVSGDAGTVPVLSIQKGTAASLSTIYEDIKFSGRVTGALASAGKLIDLFTTADASWGGETARNISIEDLLVTGSATPTFFVDYAPIITASAGGLSLRNVLFPGNYTDANSSNVVTQRASLNVSFGNLTPVVNPSFGGTGLFQPTVHTIPIAESSAAFNLIGPLTNGQTLVGVTSSDPIAGSLSQITGQATFAQLPSMAAKSVLSNTTAGSTTPLDNSLSLVLDMICSTQGDILYRDAAAWLCLAPGTSGQLLQSGGAAANPSWLTASGTGTVTSVANDGSIKSSVAANGAITAAGTLSLWGGSGDITNCILQAGVGANALTVTLLTQAAVTPSSTSPCLIAFRNATIATGDYTYVKVVAATTFVTATSGDTFGSINSTPFRLWITAWNNAGTIVLGVSKQSIATQIFPLNEGNVQSSTACSACGTATSSGVFYSTAAQTSKAIRILGYMDWASGLGTAGVWASGPTTIQLMGPGIKKPGDVVQTVVLNSTTSFSTTSAAAVSVTGMSTTINLTSAMNLVRASAFGNLQATSASLIVRARLFRGTTATLFGSNPVINSAGTNAVSPAPMMGYDFPGTVSTTTYGVGLSSDGANAGFFPGSSGPVGFLELQEIMG